MIKEDYDGLRTANVSKGGADFSLITTVAAKNEKWSSLPLFLFVTDLLLYSYFWPSGGRPGKKQIQGPNRAKETYNWKNRRIG